MRTMKNILSLAVISTKFAFLACFSLMGTFSFVPAAAEMPPCHQMAMEQEMPQESEEDCMACDISQEGWEKQFVEPVSLDAPKACEVFVVLPQWTEFFPERTEAFGVYSVPDPPDEIEALHAELVIKNSTVFVI